MLYCVTIDNKKYEIEVEKGIATIEDTTKISMDDIENKELVYTQIDSATAHREIESLEEVPQSNQYIGKETIKAPMAGVVIDIKVSVGSAVKKGDTILLLEAMKMENEITTNVNGIISEIKVAKGSYVSYGDVVIVIE